MPTLSGGPSTRFPSRTISPDETGSSPAINLSSVDLPHPDGPTTEMNSPARISNDNGFRDSTGPSAVMYVFATPSSLISACEALSVAARAIVAAAVMGRNARKRRSSREIVVGVVVLDLSGTSLLEAAVLDQKLDRLGHVLGADPEGPIIPFTAAAYRHGWASA